MASMATSCEAMTVVSTGAVLVLLAGVPVVRQTAVGASSSYLRMPWPRTVLVCVSTIEILGTMLPRASPMLLAGKLVAQHWINAVAPGKLVD
jgi:hypothetical protein